MTSGVAPQWKALSTNEKIETVRNLARQGLTEREINEATGAANGVVRVLCHRNCIDLLPSSYRKAADAEPAPASDEDKLRYAITKRASEAARRTRLEQFGGAR